MQIGEPKDMQLNDSIWTGDKVDIRTKKLANTPIGSGHNNFLKGIIVQFDLQYPEYFSPQLQRYSWIDIVSSQSKMHRLIYRQLEIEDFTEGVSGSTVDYINALIKMYNLTKDPKDFQRIISNLPSGYLKWMGISTNYLQLKTIYQQRKNHKLDEWKYFCNWIETLPMSELIIGDDKKM
jgi:hypothetical protein